MKIGAIFLVSVMALAAIGGGYAAWFDTITIEGTVNTGSVDLNVRGYSGTYIWKVYLGPDAAGTPPANELYRWHGLLPAPTDEMVEATFPGCTVELISYAYAEQTAGDADDAVTMVFDSLFPCQDFVADVIFHYEGSIPAYVFRSHNININPTNGPQYDASVYTGANWMEDHWLMKHPDGMTPDPAINTGIWIEAYHATVTLANPADPASDVISYEKGEKITSAVQLHNCDYIIAEVYVHIIQDNIFQECSGTFDFNVYAKQWNEYDPDVQAP